jgi:hypothetical protein
MFVDKINVTGDPRVQFRQARVNGKQYGMHLVTSARCARFSGRRPELLRCRTDYAGGTIANHILTIY